MLNEFLLTKIEVNDIDNIWQQPKLHSRSVFEDRSVSRRADAIRPPRSCDLTPLDYYLWGAIKDMCYAIRQTETINTLKDKIREAIGEIQLQTIDNVFKN